MADYQLDPSSQTWLYVEAWAKGEIRRNEKIAGRLGIDEREADAARGAIASCTALLALVKPSQLPPHTGDGISED